MLSELSGHVVEAGGELPDFVVRANVDGRVPVARGDLLHGAGEMFDGTGEASGDPETRCNGKQNTYAGDAVGGVADVLLHLRQFATFIRDKEDGDNGALWVLERDCRDVEGVFAPCGWVDESVRVLSRLARAVEDGLPCRRIGGSAGRAGKECSIESSGEVGIQQNFHPSRHREAGKKVAVELHASGERDARVSFLDGADGVECNCRLAIGQVFALEEGLRVGQGGSGFEITKTRRPLRGRDDVALGANNLEKVEAVLARERGGLGEVDRWIAAVGEIEPHAIGLFAGGHALEALRDIRAAARKFAAKLGDECGGALLLLRVVGIAHAERDDPRHRRDGQHDG